MSVSKFPLFRGCQSYYLRIHSKILLPSRPFLRSCIQMHSCSQIPRIKILTYGFCEGQFLTKNDGSDYHLKTRVVLNSQSSHISLPRDIRRTCSAMPGYDLFPTKRPSSALKGQVVDLVRTKHHPRNWIRVQASGLAITWASSLHSLVLVSPCVRHKEKVTICLPSLG